MRICLVIAASVLAACGDSTDISGTYIGNATFTLSSGSAGAGSATVVVDELDDGAAITLAADCALDASRDEQRTIGDRGGGSRFVFTTESLVRGGHCTLAGGVTFDVFEGTLVALDGGTVTLDVGGGTTDGGYVVYDFAGAR